jgi:hypothetical protein
MAHPELKAGSHASIFVSASSAEAGVQYFGLSEPLNDRELVESFGVFMFNQPSAYCGKGTRLDRHA